MHNERIIFANVLNKKYKLYRWSFCQLMLWKKNLQVHTATLSCNCCLLLFFTSLQSYFLNYVFVSLLAQESCQAGCLHSAPFTYLPTSPYSLLDNAESTRAMCQITFPSLFFLPSAHSLLPNGTQKQKTSHCANERQT